MDATTELDKAVAVRDRLWQLRQLAEQAGAANDDKARAAVLAELQRMCGWALRDVVSQLRMNGVPWRELADELDVAATTLHGQYKAGRGLLLPGPGRQDSDTASVSQHATGDSPFNLR